MKKGKFISIALVSAVAIMISATTALAGNNSDMSQDKGVPQQIKDLLKEVGTLQSDVQSQSSQITVLNNKITTDEQTISKLQSTVSTQEDAIKGLQSNSGADVTTLEKEVNELIYTPVGNFNTEQIPGTINYFPYTTKIGTTTDGYTIWEMNWYYSLKNTINQTFPLSKLKLISVDLPSTTATEEVFNGDTQTTTYQQTLKYVSGTPQHKNEFSFIPVNDTQFTVEFTTPANFDFNSNNSFSLLWNNGLPNDALNIW